MSYAPILMNYLLLWSKKAGSDETSYFTKIYHMVQELWKIVIGSYFWKIARKLKFTTKSSFFQFRVNKKPIYIYT